MNSNKIAPWRYWNIEEYLQQLLHRVQQRAAQVVLVVRPVPEVLSCLEVPTT